MKPHDSLARLPEIKIAQREKYETLRYYWDNSIRPKDSGIVIQRCAEGSCFFATGTRRFRVETGQVMLFEHGENSRYGLDESSSLPYVPEFVGLSPGGGSREIFEGLREAYGPVLRMESHGEACEILHDVIRRSEEARPIDRLEQAELVYRLLLSLLREQRSATRESDPVAYGHHLLETRFREARNLKEWSEQIGMSREHFARVFHERYGVPPAEYLRQLRLKHARYLLQNSRLPLEDVATQSGFASVQTFHRAYQRAYGRTAGASRSGSS
jgi:AraC-like DNA-binding protein